MTQTGTIRVDGASLYYERRGSGPALLMISGGGGDAGYYSGVAERLADTYTVLTYDRRGNSRSTVDDPTAPLRMAEQSADALAVLAHHDLTQALVFGGSGGALIGLDLAARHTAAVRGSIAHEPPVLHLLSDVDRALFAEIAEITRREGPWPAFVRFIMSSTAQPARRWCAASSGGGCSPGPCAGASGSSRTARGHCGTSAGSSVTPST